MVRHDVGSHREVPVQSDMRWELPPNQGGSMNFKIFKLFKSLMTKSAVVQMEIEEESRKKYPDWMRVMMLKKQRLMIKDKLYKLQKFRKRKKLGKPVSI
jgi:hypothetical protein